MFSPDYVWAKVVAYLESLLGPVAVETYLDDAKVIDFNDENLIIYSPSEFRRRTIREKFSAYIQDALKVLFSSTAKLIVYGDEELEEKKHIEETPEAVSQYTFENFVSGESNRLAYSAARTAAGSPGQIFNPLFIYGPPGVGKTHLLYSIAAKVRQERKSANVVFMKCEEFTNELISAIQKNKAEAFRTKYRFCDLFIIDDIQFIAGKESTQEEFFNTFNSLYEAQKQIVVSSDRKPSDMPTLEDRLRSRFEGGLIAEIKAPDLETRKEILKVKAKQMQLPLSDDICSYIAQNVTENVRQLEGVLKTLLAYRSLDNMPFDVAHVEPIVSGFAVSPRTAVPSVDLIVSTVCRYYSVDAAAMIGKNRKRNISDARNIAMYLLRDLRHMSFPDIGKAFSRDHTSVLHSVKVVEKLIRDNNEILIKQVAEIKETIENANM